MAISAGCPVGGVCSIVLVLYLANRQSFGMCWLPLKSSETLHLIVGWTVPNCGTFDAVGNDRRRIRGAHTEAENGSQCGWDVWGRMDNGMTLVVWWCGVGVSEFCVRIACAGEIRCKKAINSTVTSIKHAHSLASDLSKDPFGASLNS